MPSAVCQSAKFGRMESAPRCGIVKVCDETVQSADARRVDREIGGRESRLIVMQNWIISVTITPQRPAVAAKMIGTATDMRSVRRAASRRARRRF